MPTTEVLKAVLLPGGNIGDPTNQAAVLFKEVCDTVQNQDGVQQIYFGMRADSPDTLQLIVEWESLDHHKKFMAQDYYQPFVQRFSSVLTGLNDMVLTHVDFKPDGGVIKAVTAPVTTLSTFYFEGGEPPSDYEESAQKFFASIGDGPDGFRGHAFGRSHEEVEYEGTKSKAIVLVVGWDSREAERKFHESATFKDNAKYLRHGVTKADLQTIQFMNYVPA